MDPTILLASFIRSRDPNDLTSRSSCIPVSEKWHAAVETWSVIASLAADVSAVEKGFFLFGSFLANFITSSASLVKLSVLAWRGAAMVSATTPNCQLSPLSHFSPLPHTKPQYPLTARAWLKATYDGNQRWVEDLVRHIPGVTARDFYALHSEKMPSNKFPFSSPPKTPLRRKL
eukprot:scpid21665/ scgid19969/ 